MATNTARTRAPANSPMHVPGATMKMDAKAFLDRHMAAFSAGDVDALVEDYTDASVMITQDATLRGRDALRDFFSGLLSEHLGRGPTTSPWTW